MFTRRKPNKSGTFTVQIIKKYTHTRTNKVVKTIGTSADETILRQMEREAIEYIDAQRGPLIPMDYSDPLETAIESFMSGISNAQMQVIGPELIFGSLYDKIGYGELHNDVFRHLVICRLFNPGSKLRTVEYLQRYMTYHIVWMTYTSFSTICASERKKIARKTRMASP